MRIDSERLRRNFEEMNRVGATSQGGVHRLALSDADRQARDLFAAYVRDGGLTLSVDEIGNMFARRAGTDEGAPPILSGSHLDSVPEGGRYDGVLGVLAALEAVRTLDDQGIKTRRPIEVVNWANEEGARFPPSVLGSGVFTGVYERDYAYEIRDAEEKRYVDELERIGYRGEIPCRPRPIGGYLELHIEQGPKLVAANKQIGVVEGISGLIWLRISLYGRRDLSGTTPMHLRQDALAGAARAIATIQGMPVRVHPDLTVTVGQFTCSPNVIILVPDHVSFSVDLRHLAPEILENAERLVRDIVQGSASLENLTFEIERVASASPAAFDPSVIGIIEAACETMGRSHMRMPSGARHDALHMASLCPTGMIFVPSEGGKSHVEDEFTTWENVLQGAEVLAEALCAYANRP